MELGEKLKKARLEAGLSQRQLCGEEITRNMLSQIENGAAKPSMKTLRYLAERLGKTVSYFVEADGEIHSAMLESAAMLRRAERALEEGREVYARELLEKVTEPLFLRQKLLLLARIPGTKPGEICRELPSLDEELCLRATAALETGDYCRCEALLNGVENRETSGWNLLRGRLHVANSQWKQGAAFLHRAEEAHPKETAPLLEQCYRELRDFQRAYEYACRQKT